jgi:hypothetical protein
MLVKGFENKYISCLIKFFIPMKHCFCSIIFVSIFSLIGQSAFAQSSLLINNVQIFNGKDEKTITAKVPLAQMHQ